MRGPGTWAMLRGRRAEFVARQRATPCDYPENAGGAPGSDSDPTIGGPPDDRYDCRRAGRRTPRTFQDRALEDSPMTMGEAIVGPGYSSASESMPDSMTPTITHR